VLSKRKSPSPGRAFDGPPLREKNVDSSCHSVIFLNKVGFPLGMG
jgi:hypothetical protein